MRDMEDFKINDGYTIYAQGFSNSITGKIIDIETSGENVVLVIERFSDKKIINIFANSITGWAKDQAA